ncbi:hypothetical protein IWX49DRAFT_349469 [Phyllosticta citricarpa]|uniref:Uncharacterized protein n=2 Tax=Phyllosticta TaxID=121621 RepID=A0ABR1LS34_9PEZI
MLRRYIPRALAAPSRTFSASTVLSRRARPLAAAGARKEEKDGKESAATTNNTIAKPQQEDNSDAEETILTAEELYRPQKESEERDALTLEDLSKILEKVKEREERDSPSAARSRSNNPGEPNLLDPTDPLGLKGAKPGPGLFTNNMDPIFEFYEQDADDETGATRRPVTRERMAADRRKMEELEEKVKRLEGSLKEARNDDPMLRISETLKAVARDEKLTGPIELLGDADPDDVNAAMDELHIPMPPAVDALIERSHEDAAILTTAITAARSLQHLNNILRHAYLATDEKQRPTIRAVLWKAYKAAKLHVPDFLPAIPPPAWDMLFYSQAVQWNSRREMCMAELLADMRSLGMSGPPTPPPDGKPLPNFEDGEVKRGGRWKMHGRGGTKTKTKKKRKTKG